LIRQTGPTPTGVANEFLEAEMKQLQAAVSNGYTRGKFEPVPRDRKDWYD
jgi:hypothetical protein